MKRKILFRFLRADGRIHEVCAPDEAVTDEYVNQVYDLALDNPKKAHVLTPVHIK